MLRASAIHRRACPARAGTGADVPAESVRHPARSRNATSSFQRMKISGHVQKERRGVDQTVDPIQNPAVTGNRRGHVFSPDVAFDPAHGKIAQLSADSNNQPGQNQLPRPEKWKRKSQEPRQNHRNPEGAERALPGFVRTDFAPQRMSSEYFSERKRRDVTQRSCKNNVTKKTVSIHG